MLYIGTYIIMLDKRGVPFVLDDHNIYSACTLSRRRLFYIYVLYDIYLPNVYLYVYRTDFPMYIRPGRYYIVECVILFILNGACIYNIYILTLYVRDSMHIIYTSCV